MKYILFKRKLYQIFFESNNKSGVIFDVILIIHILLSVIIMALDSVQSIHNIHSRFIDYFEWYITIVFTIEYLIRIYISPKPKEYIGSFFGVIDFLCLLPSFLGILIGNTPYLLVIRLLRVLRIFRILRLMRFIQESHQLLLALKMSKRKVIIFIFAEIILTTIFGSIMYVIEGESNGFTSIPRSIYWAIVTMTTVGYGDISPQTNLGQGIAALAMIVAYSIIIISTGMITLSTAENYKTLSKNNIQNNNSTQKQNLDSHDKYKESIYCSKCHASLTSNNTMHYCYQCGNKLSPKG